MKALLVALASAILHGLYGLFRIFPERRRIVCISRQSNDDPIDFQLIQQYVSEHYRDYQVVILAKALDNKLTYVAHMVKQVYYLATSKVVLLDSYCIAVSLLGRSIKAPVVQMWHAMGNMKRFGFTALGEAEGRSESTARLMHMHEGYDAVLVSSLYFVKDFAAGFNVSPSIMHEAPLPKADLLLDKETRAEKRQQFIDAYPQTGTRKNIVYCPTFRRAKAPNENRAMQRLINLIDFNEYNLIFKKHPVSTQVIDDPRVIQDYPPHLDALYIADYVISDYSTVIYEAGLLDVPVYLYAYDWSDYTEKRSLNIDLQKEVPTLFSVDPEPIIEAITHDAFDHEAYRRFTQRYIALPKGESCTQHITSFLMGLAESHC